MGRAVALEKRLTRMIHLRWRALRHPPGWYDEVDEVYGAGTHPYPVKSAGTAALGGQYSDGGP